MRKMDWETDIVVNHKEKSFVVTKLEVEILDEYVDFDDGEMRLILKLTDVKRDSVIHRCFKTKKFSNLIKMDKKEVEECEAKGYKKFVF